MNNRCIWFKGPIKIGKQMEEDRVAGMHILMMGNEPGCPVAVRRTAQKDHLLSFQRDGQNLADYPLSRMGKVVSLITRSLLLLYLG